MGALKLKLNINEEKRYQTIEGFGASGAWWAQIVGNWTHEDPISGKPVRDRISELLFSKIEGIGLGIYRYNIGGGSKHSGRGTFSEPARATECFETAPGEYDWSRDAAAVYMMCRAVSDGADEVIFFVNSPIERLTNNHKTHLDKHQIFRENIKKKNYPAFAKYCADIAEHFIGEGIPVKYISPVNEPFWVWNGGQEGCHYRPSSCRKVLRAFVKELDSRKALDGVRLSGCENGDIRWFNKSYSRAVLGDPLVRTRLGALDIHSYCLHMPIPFFNNRMSFLKRFAKWMSKNYPDVPVNMSEWTHMQGGRDKGMDSALVTANVMYEDLSVLNVISWQHWIAVSEVNYCDGLIYINLDDKTFEMTKRYYVTGNFSKYVPTGSVRVDAACDDPELRLLAFKYDGGCAVIVINSTEKEKELSLPEQYSAVKSAVTDDNNDLREYDIAAPEHIKITPRSVTTIILR